MKNNNANALVVALCLLLATSSIRAQVTTQLSLEHAQELAAEYAYSLKLSRLNEEEANRTVKQTLAAGLPHISATADYNNFIEIPTQVASADAFGFPDYLNNYLYNLSEATGVGMNAPPSDPNAITELQFGTQHSATVGFTATQLIFSGSYIVASQAAKVYEQSKQIATVRTSIEVVKSVATAYHTALASLENEKMLREALSILERTLEETQALANAGFLEEHDVDRIRLSESTLKNEIKNAALQSDLTTAFLLFQIGLPVDKEVKLTDSMAGLISKISKTEFDTVVKSDVTDLPRVLESRYMLELAELNVKAKKASSLPLISAFYSNSENAQRDEFNFFDASEKWYPTQLLGFKMSMPVFGSFEGKHIREKAMVQALMAETGYEMESQSAHLEKDASFAELIRSRDAIEEAKTGLDLASKIFKHVQLGHIEGVESSFELNQARNQLLSSEGSLVGARLRLLNANSRFLAATTTIQQ